MDDMATSALPTPTLQTLPLQTSGDAQELTLLPTTDGASCCGIDGCCSIG
jgi:hypothetical protein